MKIYVSNEYTREKMNAQDTILDDITRNKLIGMVMSREWTQYDYQELWFTEKLKKENNEAAPGEPGRMKYMQPWMKEI